MITVHDLLEGGNAFSCEMAGDIDPECSFEWSEDMHITDAGYREFSSIMELPVHIISNGNIIVDTSSDTSGELDEEVVRFVNSTAGFCSVSEYKEWFGYF